jgi:uncharacterized protein
MFAYHTPGVYFEWLDTQPTLSPVRTDIAGFVGIAARGPLHLPMRVESWTQFFSLYGGFIAQGYLAYAVHAFFANGGRTCYVVRAADPLTADVGRLTLLDATGRPALQLTAASPGSWAQGLGVQSTRTGADVFSLVLRLPDGAQEQWRNLTLRPGDPRHALTMLNDPATGSRLVMLSQPDKNATAPPAAGFWRLTGGKDGLAGLRPAHLSGEDAPLDQTWGLACLETVREVAIVAIPDIMTKNQEKPVIVSNPPLCEVGPTDPFATPVPDVPPEYPSAFTDDEIHRLQQALVAHCELLKDRMAVLDPPSASLTPAQINAWVHGADPLDTGYAAFYYPWLRVPDALLPPGGLRAVPPSGHVAGIYAMVELRTGVHKPPANELIADAQDVAAAVDDVSHGNLNDANINVLRAYAGRGLRVAGARTLWPDTTTSGWRYVNIRRLFIMIERAIEQQTQWLVFEPNNPSLWREVDRVLRSFLNDLWRQGMLDGATADQAYLVRCDAATNPPEATALGQLTTLIGIQPPYPAEFVIARIGRTESGTQISEE